MHLTFAIIMLLLIPGYSKAQSGVLGQWRTLDDKTGKESSIVEIFEHKGRINGKIIKIFPGPADQQDPVCDQCDKDDPRYRKKVIGMEILRGLKKDGTEFSGGTILDPKNGKVYNCKIWLDGADLKVRGYLGPFYRTQTWKKVH